VVQNKAIEKNDLRADAITCSTCLRSLARAASDLRATSERKGKNLNGVTGFYLEAKARIWPRLSYTCHIRSAADLLDVFEVLRERGL